MAKQYGVFMTHPPNVCPISNKASRQIAKNGASQLPKLSEKYRVNVTSWNHFDPEHLSVTSTCSARHSLPSLRSRAMTFSDLCNLVDNIVSDILLGWILLMTDLLYAGYVGLNPSI